MEQEERNAKKKARIEDFGGVQNAPSSFFNDSLDDKMFTNSFIHGVNTMKTLPDNTESFLKIVSLKNEYDSRVIELGRNDDHKNNVAKQFENLVKTIADRENSSFVSRSFLEISDLSKNLHDESFFQQKLNDPNVSDFFKNSERLQKEKEVAKRSQQLNSKLRQYNENKVSVEKPESQSTNVYKKARKSNDDEKAIEMISNHYNVKAKKERQHHANYEKSTKPSTDNKIIVNSGTLWKNLRTTDSSEIGYATKNRDSSEKKKVKVSPFALLKDKKWTSQINLKPKLKIVKGKDSKQVYFQKIGNPFKKQLVRDFDTSMKNSGLSPSSRLKSSEMSKEKKIKKKPSHKRAGSMLSGVKSNIMLGRSQSNLHDDSRGIKALWETLQQTYNSKKRKDSQKDTGRSLKNLINKKAIISYKDVAKNLETIKRIEKELKNELKSKRSECKFLACEADNEAILLSGRRDGKHKTSFHKPSLSVCFENVSYNNWKKRSGK